MTEGWSRAWVRWLAGFALGALLGYALFVVGIVAVAIAGLAVVLAIVRRWRPAFVSGWLVGTGALWLGLMIRVVLSCAADPTCAVSSGTLLWIGVSVGFLLAGALLGVVSRGRRRRQAAPEE